MSARDNILARIRAQSGRQGLTSEAELAAVRDHINRRERGPLPSIARDNPLERFVRESGRLQSSVEIVAEKKDVPQAVARYLSQNGLETDRRAHV